MSRKALFSLPGIILAAVLLAASAVQAQTPVDAAFTLPYTGYLADASGRPVNDGRYDFIFTLYASEKGGDALWSEQQTGVSVKSGNLSVSLGQFTPLSKELAGRQDLWLSISVRGPQEADFTLLNPRSALNTPQAVTALSCPHSHFTDSWSGAATEYGLLLENTGAGDGLRAYSRSTVWNYAAVFGANIAGTGSGTGVYGFSNLGAGMFANSHGGDGLEATTTSSTKSAVYAHSENGNGVWAISANKLGVRGASTNDFGMEATGGGDASYSDAIGDLRLGGSRGEVFTPGSIMEFFTNGWFVIDLDNDNNSNNQFEIWNGAEVLVYKVDENGNTTATGTKSAIVNAADYGQRLMYAVESPEVWFEDLGTARLENGVITVPFEPVFAETVDLKAEYHVFLTALCEEPVLLFVTEKTSTGFTVKGVTMDNQPSSCAFDYRIMAKRQGYADLRLETLDSTPDSRSQGGN